MKRNFSKISVISAILLSLSFLVPLKVGAAYVGDREISSQAAIVLDCETGVVLYTYNADAQRVPASLTKLMAVYVIYDAVRAGEIRLDTAVKISRGVSEFSRNWEYSNVPLTEGSTVAVSRLIEVVIIRSACAATVALGEALCGSESAFVARMNKAASELGIQAHFYDCYGGSPDNRISARGLAVLSRTLIRDFPEILNTTSKKTVTFNGVTYNSSNLLLGEYTGLDGLKTGYTVPAGYCFVGTAQRGGRRLIAVTMGSTLESRYPDTRVLLDYGFSVAEKVIAEQLNTGMASPSNANLIVDGVTTPLNAYIINDSHYFKLRDIALLLNNTEKQFEVTWNDSAKTANITSGKPYTAIGGEMSANAPGSRKYVPTTSNIVFNDTVLSFEVYMIDGSNYFRLRDLGELLDFEVDWTQETRTVIINTQDNIPPEIEVSGNLLDFFFDVITGILGTDLFYDESIEILAFDLTELKVLSDTEKQSLLRAVNVRYGFETIQAAADELYEQGLLGSGNIFFKRGLLLTVTNLEVINENEFVFSVSLWRGAQSTNFYIDYSAVRGADGAWTYTNDMGMAA